MDKGRDYKWVGLGLLMVLAAGVPAVSQELRDPREVLRRSLNPLDKTYTGDQVADDSRRPPRVGRKQVAQRVYRDGRVLKIVFPTGQVLYDNGDTSQFYYPRQEVVETSPSRQSPDRFKVMERSLRNRKTEIALLDEESVAERSCYVVSVKGTNGVERRFWIDKKTFLQLRLDEIHPDSRVVSTRFERIDFGADPTPAQMAFNLPPGVRPVRRGEGRPLAREAVQAIAQRWGGPLQPKFIPGGYKLRGFYRHDHRAQSMLVAVYEGPAGQGTLSVFQGPSMGMDRMTMERKPPVRVLTGKKANGMADVILVGSLTEEQLQRVMDSIP